MDFYHELIKTVFAIAAPVLATALTAVLVQLLRRFNLQVSAEQQAKLQYYAEFAIREAEEWSAQRVKAKVATVPLAKLERAVTTITAHVPGVTRQEAIEMVHATLPALGAGATAALSDLRRAATNETR